MNVCVADITDIPEATVDDDVVLMGKQTWCDVETEITANEVADWMNTISYEVLCLFGNSNHRVYVD